MTGIPHPRAALSPTVLHRADVQEALSCRDFGQVFSLARKWGGISFSAIAECCDIKPERVGVLARGRGSITSYEKILQISDGMRIPGHLLGLLPRPWEDGGNAHTEIGPEVTRRGLESLIHVEHVGVDEWNAIAARHGRATRDHAPAQLLADLTSDLADLKDTMRSTRSSTVLRDLFQIAAQLAGLVCLTVVKLDDRGQFRRWSRTARLLAAESCDPATMSWVQSQEAHGLFYSGKIREAILVAESAMNDKRVASVGSVLAAALSARAHAAQGDPQATDQALRQAEDILDALPTAYQTTSAFGYTESQLRFHQGNALTRTEAVADALAAQERALILIPRYDYMDRALTHLDRATCIASTGDISSAITEAVDTMSNLTEDQRRGLITTRGRQLINELPAHARKLPEVAEFRDLLLP